MTTTDYLINALFLLVIVRQARERQLDLRSVVVPLALVAFVGQTYIHSIPSAGNDLLLVGLLAGAGLTLGVIVAPAATTLPDALTPREAEVLRLIAAGLSNAEIAASLFVSAATVKTHVNRIFYKTGARDRAQAVRYAYEHGIGFG
jgi:DNA-binding CsgD family transcriptional regulator